MIAVLVALSSSPVQVLADDHAGHNHHEMEPCGCAAAEDGWTIDCSNVAAVKAAYDHLVEDDCGASEDACEADAHCHANYRIVQAHHDHCPQDTLPLSMEQSFHQFEEACGEGGCVVARQFDADAAACAEVHCDHKDDMAEAVATLGSADCANDCSTAECSAAFQQVTAFHDTCSQAELDGSGVEAALHTYEDTCSGVAACNTATEAFDPNTCDEDHTVGDGGGHTLPACARKCLSVYFCEDLTSETACAGADETHHCEWHALEAACEHEDGDAHAEDDHEGKAEDDFVPLFYFIIFIFFFWWEEGLFPKERMLRFGCRRIECQAACSTVTLASSIAAHVAALLPKCRLDLMDMCADININLR